MGTSTSARQMAGKLIAASKAIDNTRRIGVEAEATVVKNALLTAGKAAGIGPTLRGVKNGKVGVRYKMTGDEALVAWYGPAHLANNNTRPHMIQPRGFVGTRSVGARAQKGAGLLALFGVNATKQDGGALRLADGRFRRRVHHPGTRGKQFFQAGREVAEKVGPPVYQSVMHRALVEVFV